MGRSRPTFRRSIDRFGEDLKPFRRAMRRAEQPAFDSVFEHARHYAPCSKVADRGNFETMVLFSMLVGLQQEVRELQGDRGHLEDA